MAPEIVELSSSSVVGDDLADNEPESGSEPREVAEGVGARFLQIMSMIRAEFQQQRELQARIEASVEDLRRMVREHREFEEAEGCGE